jgi:hypothetical protein
MTAWVREAPTLDGGHARVLREIGGTPNRLTHVDGGETDEVTPFLIWWLFCLFPRLRRPPQRPGFPYCLLYDSPRLR